MANQEELPGLPLLISRFKFLLCDDVQVPLANFKKILEEIVKLEKFQRATQDIPIVRPWRETESAFHFASERKDENFGYYRERGVEVARFGESQIYLASSGRLVLVPPYQGREMTGDVPAKTSAFGERGYTDYRIRREIKEVSPEACITRAVGIVEKLQELLK